MLRQFFDNGEAGIRIVGSTNFTFDATIGSSNDEGEGYVGSLDGQQPVEVVVESSTSVIFEDMSVRSTNGEISFGRPHSCLPKVRCIFLQHNCWLFIGETRISE